jgi:hypothetical protein
LIGVVALGLYTIQANNQHHGIRRDLDDDRLLGIHFEELVTRLGERTLVFNMCDNLVDIYAHQFKNHIIDRCSDDINGQLFDLDVEHGNERPDQRLDMCVMLREQQQPAL